MDVYDLLDDNDSTGYDRCNINIGISPLTFMLNDIVSIAIILLLIGGNWREFV